MRAGFAVNLDLLLSKSEARIDPDAVRGYLESSILEKVISGMEDLEAKADDCKKVAATTVIATTLCGIFIIRNFYQFLATCSHWHDRIGYGNLYHIGKNNGLGKKFLSSKKIFSYTV